MGRRSFHCENWSWSAITPGEILGKWQANLLDLRSCTCLWCIWKWGWAWRLDVKWMTGSVSHFNSFLGKRALCCPLLPTVHNSMVLAYELCTCLKGSAKIVAVGPGLFLKGEWIVPSALYHCSICVNRTQPNRHMQGYSGINMGTSINIIQFQF